MVKWSRVFKHCWRNNGGHCASRCKWTHFNFNYYKCLGDRIPWGTCHQKWVWGQVLIYAQFPHLWYLGSHCHRGTEALSLRSGGGGCWSSGSNSHLWSRDMASGCTSYFVYGGQKCGRIQVGSVGSFQSPMQHVQVQDIKLWICIFGLHQGLILILSISTMLDIIILNHSKVDMDFGYIQCDYNQHRCRRTATKHMSVSSTMTWHRSSWRTWEENQVVIMKYQGRLLTVRHTYLICMLNYSIKSESIDVV